MKYYSTRNSAERVTASQAIAKGLAPDGGLYVPETLPRLTEALLRELMTLDYRGRASRVMKLFLEDFSEEELASFTRAAYGERYDTPEIAPVRQLNETTAVLELWHGPTIAFKDLALQILPHLMTTAARKNRLDREIVILTATSGDTGKAALEGFLDVTGTSCTVFYPLDGVSDVQRLQMVTTGGKNTHVIAVQGNFDDAQTGVKELFASETFAEEMNRRGKVLSSANSINFGRLVPQIVYYFSAYADLVAQGAISCGEPVNFCVPTGNFGNILAGYYAKQMGLPVGRLICASNRNKVLTDFFDTGIYSTHRLFFKTKSPSMDILVSSNLERLLFGDEADGRDIRNGAETLFHGAGLLLRIGLVHKGQQ